MEISPRCVEPLSAVPMQLCIVSGVGEIRTHGTLAGSPVFKTGAFNHSATTPRRFNVARAERSAKQDACSIGETYPLPDKLPLSHLSQHERRNIFH